MVAPHTLPSDFSPLWNELRGKVLVAGSMVLRSLELSASAVREQEDGPAIECFDIHETIDVLEKQIHELGRRLMSIASDEQRLTRTVVGSSLGQILTRLSARSLEIVGKARQVSKDAEEEQLQLLDRLFTQNRDLLHRAMGAFADEGKEAATQISFDGAEQLNLANRIDDQLRDQLRRDSEPSICSISLIQLTRIEQEISGLIMEVARELLPFCDPEHSRRSGIQISR